MHIRYPWLWLVLLLSLFFFQVAFASPHNSVTFDEEYHVTLGYVYLKAGDLRFHVNQNPPLAEAIVSLPLLLRPLDLPTSHPAYKLWGDVYLFSDVFLWQANHDAQALIQDSRLVTAGMGVLLGLLLYVWGRQLLGEPGGLLAVFLLALDPNLIANALPTLDLGLAFFATLAMWRFWRWLQSPTWVNLVLAGGALGLALGTKFTAVMLLPSMALVLLFSTRPALPSKLKTWLWRIGAFASLAFVAWLIVWAVYRFQVGPLGNTGLVIPAPLYFESFGGMFFKSSEGRLNFLNGQVSAAGWPYYFLVALALKTPLPTLALILAGLVRWPWKMKWRESLVLLAPAFFFFLGVSISKLQLGYRYIAPVLPFLFLAAGQAAVTTWPRWAKVPAILLGLWLAAGTLSIFPHYLSYFNELGGGPANGYQHLVDSNLDWGQDLPALRQWLGQHDSSTLRLAYFGTAHPDQYGITVPLLPGYPHNWDNNEVNGFTSASLEPGRYALSATLLRLGLVFKQPNLYQAFQAMRPVDRAGYSILIYDVSYPPGAPIRRAVISGIRASDVPFDILGAKTGSLLRAKWCAWPDCFIFTPNPARYIAPGWPEFAPDWAAQAKAQATRQSSFRDSDGAQFLVAELDARNLIQNRLEALQASQHPTPTLPITFTNGLALVGFEAGRRDVRPGGSIDLTTLWRVADRVSPPLAVFVHLLGPSGDIAGQQDGWGAAMSMLEPGDVVLQHHVIPIAATAAPGEYRLIAGLYNPQTMQRYWTQPGLLPPVDTVLLNTLQVSVP